MTLRKKGQYYYGDSQEDIQEYLADYSRREYPVAHFAGARCLCGNTTFLLALDDEVGAAVRICTACGTEHPIGDSADFLDEADLGEAECPCGYNTFEITAGVALYEGSEDVKWFYVGCRCTQCDMVACYGDWKNEYIGYRELLKAI